MSFLHTDPDMVDWFCFWRSMQDAGSGAYGRRCAVPGRTMMGMGRQGAVSPWAPEHQRPGPTWHCLGRPGGTCPADPPTRVSIAASRQPTEAAVFLLPHRHIHPTCTVINEEREAYRRFTKGQQGLVLPGNHAAVCRRIRGPSIRCGLRQTWEVVKLRKGTAVWPALACAPGRKETRSSSR